MSTGYTHRQLLARFQAVQDQMEANEREHDLLDLEQSEALDRLEAEYLDLANQRLAILVEAGRLGLVITETATHECD